MCSGWAASPRQEQDPSVMPQHLLSWLPIPKARTALANIMLHVCGISVMPQLFALRPDFLFDLYSWENNIGGSVT